VNAIAVILEKPEHLSLGEVALSAPGASDVVVDVFWSGISTGTERLLYRGRMPDFPGMGYPLVPGYEAVGEVVEAGPDSGFRVGEQVFVPGARCFIGVRGLFGGAASRLVVPGSRVVPMGDELGEKGVLIALAATAYHAITAPGVRLPDLIVGHGVLGRLVARLAVTLGGAPVVWDTDPARHAGAQGYRVLAPDADDRRDYAAICDVSGDGAILDRLIARLAPGGEITLAGFYEAPLSFAFPPAFMREARIRVAAEFKPPDLAAVTALVERGRLNLDGLVTHRRAAEDAASAYATAFTDPSCLKMVIDWRSHA
jgi:bacteriochlorophyllide a dehydrogenase